MHEAGAGNSLTEVMVSRAMRMRRAAVVVMPWASGDAAAAAADPAGSSWRCPAAPAASLGCSSEEAGRHGRRSATTALGRFPAPAASYPLPSRGVPAASAGRAAAPGLVPSDDARCEVRSGGAGVAWAARAPGNEHTSTRVVAGTVHRGRLAREAACVPGSLVRSSPRPRLLPARPDDAASSDGLAAALPLRGRVLR